LPTVGLGLSVEAGTEEPARRGRAAAVSRFLGVRRELGAALVSVAGLVGRPVRGADGELVGRLADVVVRSEAGYPAVAGFVVRIGPRRAWVHAQDVAGVEQGQLRLLSSRFDLQEVLRRPGEIQLVADVIDHQLVDMDGVQVVRAADLYLAAPSGTWRLVGVDVSLVSFLRRALPGRPGRHPSPAKVLDWAGVQPFGITGGPVRLSRPNSGVHRLRPAEMADLLEDLGRAERRELLAALDTEAAADALEEMSAPDVLAVLRDAPVERAAELVASMESDEAADALRDLPEDEREDMLRAMPAESARELRTLLTYEEATAGGVMTSGFVLVGSTATVGDAVAALRAAAGRSDQGAGLVVVDQEGRLLDDVTVFELLGVDPGRPIAELVGPPWPVTVPPSAGLREVVSTMTDNRGSSIVVVDEQERPIGRILADDVIDALTRRDDRRWPWQRRIGPSS
jgi:CBS domain-containing protein